MSEQVHPVEELSQFIDDELTQERRAEVERHLATCAECAGITDELRAVAVFARNLPSRPPERDLWPEIEARLDAGVESTVGRRVLALPTRSRGWRRQFTFTMPQLAAAGFLLVALSSAGVWLALRGVGPSPVSGPIAGVQPGTSSSDATNAATDFSTARYESAIRDLQTVLAENRDHLDPKTVQTVEQNLAVIDAAIEQARQALASDPQSQYLNGHLAEQMQRKMRVLQQAAVFATADYSVAGS